MFTATSRVIWYHATSASAQVISCVTVLLPSQSVRGESASMQCDCLDEVMRNNPKVCSAIPANLFYSRKLALPIADQTIPSGFRHSSVRHKTISDSERYTDSYRNLTMYALYEDPRRWEWGPAVTSHRVAADGFLWSHRQIQTW